MTLQQLRFPAIPRDQRKNIKLTTNDIASIRRLYNVGIRIKSLADAWRVTPTAIRYWVNENSRQHTLDYNKTYHKTEYLYNPDYKRTRAQNKLRQNKARYANEPAYRNYISTIAKINYANKSLGKLRKFLDTIEK